MSSTKPHTVNLYTDVEEFPAPVVQITNCNIRINSQTSNSGGSVPIESEATNFINTDSEEIDIHV